MVNNELISAISKMMDDKFALFETKLNIRFDKIDERLSHLEEMQDNVIIPKLHALENTVYKEIKPNLHVLNQKVELLTNDVNELKKDVNELKNDVSELKNDVSELKNDVNELKNDVNELKNDVNELKNDVQKLKSTQNNEILPRLKSLEIAHENVILPLINEIHACYYTTYDRYAKAFESHEQMRNDISVLKSIVARHSRQLDILSS